MCTGKSKSSVAHTIYWFLQIISMDEMFAKTSRKYCRRESSVTSCAHVATDTRLKITVYVEFPMTCGSTLVIVVILHDLIEREENTFNIIARIQN